VAAGTGRHLAAFTPTVLFLVQFLPYFDQYALSHRLWSPDSEALVLPMQDSGTNRVFVVPASGGRARALAEGSIAFWSQQ
jgi:TolB protein